MCIGMPTQGTLHRLWRERSTGAAGSAFLLNVCAGLKYKGGGTSGPRAAEGVAMNKADRERRHSANLERIDRVQMVVGRGDRSRVDRVGTVLEQARLMSEELSSHAATELGLAALDRLLRRAEERGARKSRDIIDFIEALWGNKPLPLLALRGLDQATGDDMMAVLDAYRYARLNLIQHVEGGARRVGRVVNRSVAVAG